jgi:hypothetical protein
MGHSELNYDAIPGDATLIDSDHNLAPLHSEKDIDIVLIPNPSDDADDPLNWSNRRKNLALFCMVVYSYGVGVPGSAIYSIIPEVAEKTGLTTRQVNTSTGYLLLFLGISCFFFQPRALQYGKRNVYLLSMFASSLISIWTPHCKTNAEWIGSKVLQGFLASPVESLCEITVSDISFQHQLARNMSIYAAALAKSNFCAPMIAGFISDGIGWEWVMYLSAIWSAVCFVFLFFFMEETNYERKLNPNKILEKMEIDGLPTVTEILSGDVSVEEKKIETVLSHQTIEDRLQEVNEAFVVESSDAAPQKPLKTYRDKVSFTGRIRSEFVLSHLLMSPIKMVQFPVILWCGFLYGSSLVWFNLMIATEAMILGAPPYSFSSSMCGLAYISAAILTLIFQLTAGYLSDWIKVAIARRRGGLSYAEDRLWVLVIYMVLGLISSIGWGVGA